MTGFTHVAAPAPAPATAPARATALATHRPAPIDQALPALVAAWQHRPFEWGVADCCQFARAAAAELHGLARPWPTYRTEAEALAICAAHGGLLGLLAMHGLSSRPLAAARRGDFVIFDAPHSPLRQAIAVVTDVHALAPSKHGLRRVPRLLWQACLGPGATAEPEPAPAPEPEPELAHG